MPTTLRLVIAALFLLVGVALVVVAVLGARSRLPRNRWTGVRTAQTLDSPAAWVSANRVAAPLLGAAGVVGVLAGAALLAGPTAVLAWVLTGVGIVGGAVFVGLGGALGDRAARLETASREAQPAGCTGTCAGCDLIAGCRPQTA